MIPGTSSLYVERPLSKSLNPKLPLKAVCEWVKVACSLKQFESSITRLEKYNALSWCGGLEVNVTSEAFRGMREAPDLSSDAVKPHHTLTLQGYRSTDSFERSR